MRLQRDAAKRRAPEACRSQQYVKVKKKTSPLAIASILVGILSLLSLCIGVCYNLDLLGSFGFLGSFFGVSLGLLSLIQVKCFENYSGRLYAIIGVALSGFILIKAIVVLSSM